jgi:uncharacterized protein (TIGR03437 family)
MYGTGLRGRSALTSVSAKLDTVDSQVLYASSSTGLVGVDQINIPLSASLAGRGEISVTLTVDGKPANTVRINVK